MDSQLIPMPIAEAAVGMLQNYYPDLTAKDLVNALGAASNGENVDKLWTRSEAAKALRVSVQTLDRAIKDGQIKKVKIRGRVFVPQSALRNQVSDGMSLNDHN